MNNITLNNNQTVEVLKDLTDGVSYPTEAGLYITRDYGDGRVDIEEFDGNDWSMVYESVMTIL